MHWEGPISLGVLPSTTQPQPNHVKTPDKSRRKITDIPLRHSSKISRSPKARKVWGLSETGGSPGDMTTRRDGGCWTGSQSQQGQLWRSGEIWEGLALGSSSTALDRVPVWVTELRLCRCPHEETRREGCTYTRTNPLYCCCNFSASPKLLPNNKSWKSH